MTLPFAVGIRHTVLQPAVNYGVPATNNRRLQNQSRTAMSVSDQNAEFNKFADHAANWWQADGAMRPLHDINGPRTDFIDQRAPVAGKKVLDVGCGGGLLAEELAQRGAHVTGIDGAAPMIETARAHAAESGLDITYRTIQTRELVAEAKGAFDIVIGYEMLEHVDEPNYVVDDCVALCKPDGDLFFSTINRSALAWAIAIGGAEYALGLLPRGTHEYSKLIRPSELARWLRDAGVEPSEIIGMHYNPLTRSATFGGQPRVNYFVHAERQQAPR
ncbi:bifunctional 2-polyprenyl-6-hydroxyphenol methylase/3-demethylubiquinol 3-O-methyltransferase UbiG [Salinisphaera orenii]|uniref:bifunctional 2-polyprenyl-6-hydroxyphenol methylase/3-demethylubiquinol 3-O-methyltransferase UbiG n=1 Tax=Salinisphaera orenii TaxID=856731 RepID=UPI00296F080D